MTKYHKLKAEYLKKGYSIHKNVISNNIVKEIQKHIQFLTKRFSETRPESFHHDILVDDPFIHHILDQKSIKEISKFYLGPDISLFGAHYIAKKPYEGKPVGWHQDGSYWPLKPMNVISLWVAGTESNENNGCMRVIPESHNKKLIHSSKMEQLDQEKYVLDLGIKKKDIRSENARSIELSPGDMSIHNPNIIHGSDPNFSSKWRIGLTLRIIPSKTFVNREGWKCIHISGAKNEKIKNNYVKRPVFDKNKHMAFDGCENFN